MINKINENDIYFSFFPGLDSALNKLIFIEHSNDTNDPLSGIYIVSLFHRRFSYFSTSC